MRRRSGDAGCAAPSPSSRHDCAAPLAQDAERARFAAENPVEARRAAAGARLNRFRRRGTIEQMTESSLTTATIAAPPQSRARLFAPFEWVVALRYVRARRANGFVSVIAGFSFLGITLGVATLIVVMSVMNGFHKELMDKIVGIDGHAFVQAAERPLTDWARGHGANAATCRA